MSQLTKFTVACTDLRLNGQISSSRSTGLTANAAAPSRSPARSLHRAAVLVAWLLVVLSSEPHHGVAALPSGMYRPSQPLPTQRVGRAYTSPQSHPIVPSSTRTSTDAAFVGPNFLQMAETQDNGTAAAAVRDNETRVKLSQFMRRDRVAFLMKNRSESVDTLLYRRNKANLSAPSSWMWKVLRAVIRGANSTTVSGGHQEVNRSAGFLQPSVLAESLAMANSSNNLSGSLPTSSISHGSTEMLIKVPILDAVGQARGLTTAAKLVIHLGLALSLVAIFIAIMTCHSRFAFVWKRAHASGVRAQVTSLPLARGRDVEDMFQGKERYDCAIFQPFSPGVVVRLQGKVLAGPQTLRAPLTRRSCVHFSASASAQRHDGIHQVPIAFHSVCADFTVALLDAAHITFKVCGQDIALFDMQKGNLYEEQRFADAPDHWQDFVLAHRAPSGDALASAALRTDLRKLEFRQVALDVGAVVTCVGELRRGHDGALELVPWQSSSTKFFAPEKKDESKLSLSDRWRTSWERDLPSDSCDQQPEKVLLSDDAGLLCVPRTHALPWDCCMEREKDDDEDEEVKGPLYA